MKNKLKRIQNDRGGKKYGGECDRYIYMFFYLFKFVVVTHPARIIRAQGILEGRKPYETAW